MKNADLKKILEEHHTPFYIFEIDKLKKRSDYLRSRLPAGVSLCYAVKANPFVADRLCPYIDKLEACSPGEMQLCLEKGINLEKIVVSGVYKTAEFIEKIVKDYNGVNCFTVESVAQYQLLSALAEKYGVKVRLLLRLTSGNQFGLDEKSIKNILLEYDSTKVEIIGIQYFSGTQKISLKKAQRELDYADDFLCRLQNECGFQAAEFEYGPGFAVSYFDTDNFDEDEYLAAFSNMLLSMKFKSKITLEIGRSLVADCGSYLTKVVDIKRNDNQNYAIVDGGINHITYYGQSMAMKRPCYKLLRRFDKDVTENWNICGSLCTINDILMKNVPMSEPDTGDVIVFEKAGAYCMTEGISLFLSRDLPEILLADETTGKVICAREAYETYKLNISNQ